MSIRYFLLFPILIFIASLVIGWWLKRKDSRKFEPAFKDKVLRPPGESLKQRIEALREEFDEYVMNVLFGAMFGVLIFALSAMFKQESIIVFAVTFGLATSASYIVALYSYRIIKLSPKMRRNRLGFEGERYVGDQLNQLMLLGYHVYHDIQFDGYNVDHLIIGQAGVFSIETKTRRKLRDGGKQRAKVIFDGKELEFPNTRDSHGIDQAKQNARQIGKWLSSAVGEEIRARAILCLPGWYVESKTLAPDIDVVNPKNVVHVLNRIGRSAAPLPEKLIKQICYQVEQKNIIED